MPLLWTVKFLIALAVTAVDQLLYALVVIAAWAVLFKLADIVRFIARCARAAVPSSR